VIVQKEGSCIAKECLPEGKARRQTGGRPAVVPQRFHTSCGRERR